MDERQTKTLAALEALHLKNLESVDRLILLYRVAGMANGQIGEHVGLTASAVQKRIRRVEDHISVLIGTPPSHLTAGAWVAFHGDCCLSS